MVATPGADKEGNDNSQRSLHEARVRFNEEMRHYRQRQREKKERRERLARFTDTNKAPGEDTPAFGRGRQNRVIVDVPSRESHTGTTALSRVERRIDRLSNSTERTRLNESAVALDFELFSPPPEYRRQNERQTHAMRQIYGKATGGASTKSVVIFGMGAERELEIREFAIRLAAPDRSHFPETTQGRTDTVVAVHDLVARLQPPVHRTSVWLRPVPNESPFAVGFGTAKRFMKKTHPHIGAFSISAHPAIFLDFLTDLLDAYPEELLPPDE